MQFEHVTRMARECRCQRIRNVNGDKIQFRSEALALYRQVQWNEKFLQYQKFFYGLETSHKYSCALLRIISNFKIHSVIIRL